MESSETSQFDPPNNSGVSDRVQAVLDWFGITNLLQPQWIDSNDSPTLIQQCTQDVDVPPQTSITLFNELSNGGVFAELQMVAGAGHKFAGNPNPDYSDIVATAIRFLNAKVRDNPNPLPQ